VAGLTTDGTDKITLGTVDFGGTTDTTVGGRAQETFQLKAIGFSGLAGQTFRCRRRDRPKLWN
jgi:hypothetical protein